MEALDKRISEHQLDLDEMQEILDKHATRDNVKLFLSTWVAKLKEEKAKLTQQVS